MEDFKYLSYETADDGSIAIITLNRPRQRNAQNRGLLVELDRAFAGAESDDDVRVVILRGAGDSFSSGHDMGSSDDRAERADGPERHPSFSVNGGGRQAGEQMFLQEWHYYFRNTLRWRDLRKITIASVQGPVYAAGLMLAWCCDLIVAADDARFADVVGTRLGMCGVEYFAHPWELGPRKAKELLLTGDAIDADEAHRLGFVSKIFPRCDLEQSTLDFARRIASLPSATSLFIKESVNQTVDQMGFHNALHSCFNLHVLNHRHWAELNGNGWACATPEHGIPDWREAPPVVYAETSTVRSTRTA